MAAPVIPVVRLFFACERAVYRPKYRAYSLIAPLPALSLPPGTPFPYEAPDFACYAQLSDALGTFRFAVEVRYEDADRVLVRSGSCELTFSPRGRISCQDVVFPFSGVRFPGAGLYRLQLMCNHVPLRDGQTDLRVLGGS